MNDYNISLIESAGYTAEKMAEDSDYTESFFVEVDNTGRVLVVDEGGVVQFVGTTKKELALEYARWHKERGWTTLLF